MQQCPFVQLAKQAVLVCKLLCVCGKTLSGRESEGRLLGFDLSP